MSEQLVRIGIQTNYGSLHENFAPHNLFMEFIHEVRSVTLLPIERT